MLGRSTSVIGCLTETFVRSTTRVFFFFGMFLASTFYRDFRCGAVSPPLSKPHALQPAETLPPGLPRPYLTPLRGPAARSDRTPRESLDAPEDLPKQATRQVALGQLKNKEGIPAPATASGPMTCGCSCASSPTISAISCAGWFCRSPSRVGPGRASSSGYSQRLRTRAGSHGLVEPPQPPLAVKWPSRRPEGRASPAPTNSGAGVASTLFAHAQRFCNECSRGFGKKPARAVSDPMAAQEPRRE